MWSGIFYSSPLEKFHDPASLVLLRLKTYLRLPQKKDIPTEESILSFVDYVRINMNLIIAKLKKYLAIAHLERELTLLT